MKVTKIGMLDWSRPREVKSPKWFKTAGLQVQPFFRFLPKRFYLQCERIACNVNPMTDQPFSQLLRQWRKQFNLSQVSACKFLRVPYRTYQDWENEQRNPKQLTREAVEERMKKYVPTPE